MLFIIGQIIVASFQLSSEKVIHSIGAGIYFLGVIGFTIAQTCIQYKIEVPRILDLKDRNLRKSVLVFYTRVLCCAGLLVSVIIFGCFFAIPSLHKYNRNANNVAQGAEWMMAVLKCVYILTFMYDFWTTEFTDIMQFKVLTSQRRIEEYISI